MESSEPFADITVIEYLNMVPKTMKVRNKHPLPERMHLKEIVLIGRTFDEYRKIFHLQDIDPIKEKILDAGSGVSSFTAQACAKGWDVTASDRIYGIKPAQLEEKAQADLRTVIDKLLPVAHKYRWDRYKSPVHLQSIRKRALGLFMNDYKKRYGTGRYVTVDYPDSPFHDRQFTMTLMSHFLFLFDDKLSYAFHRRVIRELMRITSREIRIYPVVNFAGDKSTYVKRLMNDPSFDGSSFELSDHGFEFLIGAKEMLVIKKAEGLCR